MKILKEKSLPFNSRFIMALIGFIALSAVTFKIDHTLKVNSSSYTKAIQYLERTRSTINKQLQVISNIKLKRLEEGRDLPQDLIAILRTNIAELEGIESRIQKTKSIEIFGIPVIRNLYFENSWRVDESITHLNKLVREFIKLTTNKDWKERKNLSYELERHGENLLHSLDPIQKEFSLFHERSRQYASINDYVFRISIILMLIAAFVYLYRPWRSQLDNFIHESHRLKEVLTQSEVKGNIYSWELNYTTKEVRHSEYLSAIFNIDGEGEYSYLYDEIALFTTESRELFLEAIESSILKNEPLNIIVNVVTKNKRRYWLEYSAKPKKEGDVIRISGTVQNVTSVKIAEKRFKDIFERLELPAVIFGDGQVRDINKSARDFFGVEDDKNLTMLHPAVLFPLYQSDGRSSLEKLSQSIEEMREGKTLTNDWSFHAGKNGIVKAKATMFNIPYVEADLHLLIVSDDSVKNNFERRIVYANNQALFYKRAKTEYIYHMGIVLQGLVESVDKIYERVAQKSKNENVIDREILFKIRNRLNDMWNNNTSQYLEDGAGLIIFDFHEMIQVLESRWQKMALDNDNRLNIKIDFDHKYYWGDVLKLKAIFIGIVEDALLSSTDAIIKATFKYNRNEFNKEIISLEVSNSDLSWPGQQWRDISQHTDINYKDNKITPYKVFKTIESLDGYFECSFRSENLMRDGYIRCHAMVESVLGNMFKNADGIYFMMNQDEYFVPYNDSALSATDIWSHFGGEWDLIESTIRDFLDYYPTAIKDLEFYMTQKDGEGIANTANELYGVIAHFPFSNVLERVMLIQKYGEYLKFSKVEREIEILKNDLERLSKVLEEFLPEHKEKLVG